MLDGFIHRVFNKQPLSCPIDIKRFFVTPKQSGQICLLSTFLGESGNIFFPKLDSRTNQIYFKDIAFKFLKKNGYKPLLVDSENEAKNYIIKKNSNEYPIYFFKTDTSGEKPFEEFYTNKENFILNKYHSLGYINTSDIKISINEIQKDFKSIFNNPRSVKVDLIKVIKKYITDFSHIETGKNLDQKM